MLKQSGLDAEAREVAKRIQSVLTVEIHHRMKNMLTMVTAIVRQSMGSSTSLVGAEHAIFTRLIAMARAYGLKCVIQNAVAQHSSTAGCTIVTGEELQVMPSAILPLILN